MGWDTLTPQVPVTESQAAIRQYQDNQDVWSASHAFSEAFQHENMVGQLYRSMNVPMPDPSYLPSSAAIKQDPRAAGVDPSHFPYLLGSQSDAEMGQRIDALRDDLNYRQQMAKKGWGGTAIQLAAGAADPAGWVLSAISPVGGVAAKFGRMASILASGAEGAALNVGMEAAAPSPSEEQRNYLGAAAGGFLFGMGGGALGSIMHPHPDVAPAFADMTKNAKSILDDVTAGTSTPYGASSAGAEQNLGHIEPVRTDVSDFTSKPFMDSELGKAAFTRARMDLAGQMKGSENPLTAALGSRLVEDAVGNADHSAVNRAVSVEAGLIRGRQDTFLAREYQDAWNDYRDRNGINVLGSGAAEVQFRERIADAIDNLDPTSMHNVDPAVTKAADAYRRNYADFQEMAQNPGILDGSEMAPLRGMAEVEKNPNYFPHIYDFFAFGEHVRQFGDKQMKGLLADSILSHVPTMTPEDATRLGAGLYKGLRNVQTGQEVSMSRMLSGDDQDGLRAFLGAETDMSREAIERIINALNPPPSEGTISRTKRATPINVHFTKALKDLKTGEMVPVKAKDFMERDAVHVGTMYNRQMAAQVALARLRVENPRWREGEMVPKPYGPEEHLNDPATGKAFIHEAPSERTTAAPPEPKNRLEPLARDPSRSKLDTLRAAFRQLVTEDEHGLGVGAQFTDLRKVLSKFSRAEQDAMLKEVPQSEDIVFSQIDDKKKWTPEVKEAAFTPLGPEDPWHMLKINGTYPKAPGPKTEKVPGNIRPEGVERGEFTADGLNYHEEPDGYHISTSGLPDDLRGKGTGIAMYRMLAEKAQREGKVLHSDAQLTPESFKVYQKLKREGYDVRQHPDLEFHEWDSKDGDAGVQTPGQEFPVFSIHPDPVEMIREEDPNNPRYLVDGIRGPSEVDKLMKQVRAIGDELGHNPDKTEKDVERLQFTIDAISGRGTSPLDRGKLGQFVRLLKAWNFTRVMNQVGFAQMAELWTGVGQVGIRAALSSMPELRQLFDGIRGGRDQTDIAMQLEHMAEPGTEMLRGSMHIPLDDLGNRVGNGASRMDKAERLLGRATRLTSMISGMAPLTTFQSKWMAKAALARFAMDATGEKSLNVKRMRVLGISEKEQALIQREMQDKAGFVRGESGTDHRILNLDAWDPQARHALEYGLHVWTRKMIQENDLGQMNMLLGTSMGRLMGQFRMFMMGAYTKNTLHNLHMRDWETLSSVLGSTVLAAATYYARTYLMSLGRSDKEDYLKKRLDNRSVAAAAIQGGAFSSIMPMFADLGTYAMGFDPLFDSRVSGQAAQGLTSNPTVGLLNNALDASRGISGSLFRGEQYNQRDARALESMAPFANFLPMVWATNSMISGLPTQDTHKHRN